jgi:hypothetical protein
MNQDVKGLFLGVKFVSSRVFFLSWLGCSSKMSCLSRRGVVLETCDGISGQGKTVHGLNLGAENQACGGARWRTGQRGCA